MFENTKCRFWQKCRGFAYKGLKHKPSMVALDREKRFDLIYTIVKVFIFGVKNAIVWFLLKTMRCPSCFLVDFWPCLFGSPKSWAKASESNCQMRASVWCYSDNLKWHLARKFEPQMHPDFAVICVQASSKRQCKHIICPNLSFPYWYRRESLYEILATISGIM